MLTTKPCGSPPRQSGRTAQSCITAPSSSGPIVEQQVVHLTIYPSEAMPILSLNSLPTEMINEIAEHLDR